MGLSDAWRHRLMLLVGGLVLVMVGIGVLQRERVIANGEIVLLELAPVDPRSLMQGDYMALRYVIAREIDGGGESAEQKDGYAVLSLDDNRVARLLRTGADPQTEAGQVRMRYRSRTGRVRFATNAFFFEEGTAERYESARYGEFRLGSDGEAILIHLRNERFERLGKGVFR